MKFTEIAVKNLKPRDTKYYVRADMGNGKHGFALCVYPTGVKSWFFIYTFEGRRYSMALGNYPTVTIAQATKMFDKHWAIFADGKNPSMIEEHKKDERRKAPTVADLVDEYMERHARRFKKSWEKDEEILNRDVIPAWGKRKAADITKRDVILLLEEIVDRGAPGMANNTFQIIRKMYNFAIEKDILQNTPCYGIKLPSPKQARERVLSEAEIRTIWTNLDTCALSDESRRALKLELVTGQRPGEVVSIHSNEINGRWWTIPPEKAKNKKAHRVYLTDLALELIGDTRDMGHIFPCPHKSNEGSMSPHALTVAVRRNLAFETDDESGNKVKVNRLGVEAFTPHDLRRTAATFMAQMGEMDEVIDAVLNHAKKGVIKVYNLYRYDKEKQAALETWARKLESIVNGIESNVIPFRKAR